MTDDSHDDLSPRERDAYASLREGCDPPESLEQRVVAGLREEGLLSRPPRPRRLVRRLTLGGIGLAAAALLVISGMLAGLAIGRRPAAEPGGAANAGAATSPRFVLFLHEDAGYHLAGDAGERVDEYRRWAQGLREGGRLVAGEKLMEEGTLLGPDSAGSAMSRISVSGGDIVAGYFVIAAPDDQTALGIARDCPHLRHGGRIELRRIDPV
jgi:hypothetical protein